VTRKYDETALFFPKNETKEVLKKNFLIYNQKKIGL